MSDTATLAPVETITLEELAYLRAMMAAGNEPTDTPMIAFIKSLADFQEEMPVVPKTKTATVPTRSGGQYRYKYADLGVIVPVVMPRLKQFGFSHTCTSRYTPEGFILTGHLMHRAGHVMTADLPLFGERFQEIGGSITYARRYSLCMQTGLITDEDEDAEMVNESPRAKADRPVATKGSPGVAKPIPLPPDKRITDEQIAQIAVYELSDTAIGQIIEATCNKVVNGWDFVTREDGERILRYLDPTIANE